MGEHVRRALGAVGERVNRAADGDEGLDVVDARERARCVDTGDAMDDARLGDEKLRDRPAVLRPFYAASLEVAIAEGDAEHALVEVDPTRQPRNVCVEAAAEARRRLEEERAAPAERDLRVAGAAEVTERAGAAPRFVDDTRFVFCREARRIRLGHHDAERLLARDDDALGDAVAREAPLFDPPVDRVLAPFEPRLDHHAREPRRRRVHERVVERGGELVIRVDACDAALPPPARRLHDDRERVVTHERARGIEGRAGGERRNADAAGRVGGAHCVLLLAATDRLGIAVERQPQARGDVGRRAHRDLAPRARDGSDACAPEERGHRVGVARRHLFEGLAVRDADGVRVHVDAEHVEAERARRSNERELGEAAAEDEDAGAHGDGGVGVFGFNDSRNSSSSAWCRRPTSSSKLSRSAML